MRVGMFGSDKGGISGLHVIVRIFDDSLSLHTVINNNSIFLFLQVLASLPDNWNIATILPAAKLFIRQTAHNARMTKLTKNLCKEKKKELMVDILLINNQYAASDGHFNKTS